MPAVPCSCGSSRHATATASCSKHTAGPALFSSRRGVTVCCAVAPAEVQKAPSSSSSARAQAAKVPVAVCFKPSMNEVQALPGECFADVAARAGVDVQLGCNQGNCGVCEMELQKFSLPASQVHNQPLTAGSQQVIRTCIARVPPGFARLEVSELVDEIWGVDGFDT